jgi:alpha-glucosidase/alpha-D-xyloside xylohydrolase
MDEASEFRVKELPCDTMIYLGTGFSPSGWNTDHGSFTFNTKVFPDPAKMIQELHSEHLHVILHLTRPPLQLHGTVGDNGAEAQDVNDAAHYWATHREVFRLGVDGWWPDEGDALSPDSRLARIAGIGKGPYKNVPTNALGHCTVTAMPVCNGTDGFGQVISTQIGRRSRLKFRSD